MTIMMTDIIAKSTIVVWGIYIAISHFTFVKGYTHDVPSNQLQK